MTLKAISLFTGAGGLDYGFEAAAFETRVAVEMEAAFCATLRANRHWRVLQADINQISTNEILSAAQLRIGEADVLIGGPPCQPFSKAGYWASGDSKRLADPRASTLHAYLRVLEESRPKTFLLENVEGLGFKGKDEGLQLIASRLHKINQEYGTSYSAAVAVLNAAEFGVPQFRKRLFVVGARDGRRFKFPDPTHAENPLDGQAPLSTAWDALHDLAEPLESDLRVKGKWADLLPTIPEGANYLWHTERGGGLPLFGWRRRFWCFLLKLAKDRPSWTIQAQPGPATGPFHWNNRRLSMRELARLQTFPDDVSVAGSISVAHKQLGNAVPSLLAEVLARQIKSQLLDRQNSPHPLLTVSRAPTAPPPPRPLSGVPEKYLSLRGIHSAHPGTGRGYAALRRREGLAA